MPISGPKIKEYMDEGKISINPIFDEQEQIQASKIDLRLDNVFYRTKSEQSTYRDTLFDKYDHLEKIVVPFEDVISDPLDDVGGAREDATKIQNGFVLHPDEFVLGQTFEYVDISEDLRGLLTGRSSMGREGVIVHSTATLIDPNYSGPITFELSTNGNLPVVLYPRQRIASIEFEKVEGESKRKESRFGDVVDPSPEDQGPEDKHILSKEI